MAKKLPGIFIIILVLFIFAIGYPSAEATSGSLGSLPPAVGVYPIIPLSSGGGLHGEYYALGGTTVILTVDGEGPINHGWNGSCPDSSYTIYQDACGLWAGSWNSGDTMEEVLTGYIEAPQTGHYEFHASIDDYLEITINGVSDLVDGSGAYSIELDLIQGHFYPVEMHFKNRGGSSNLALFWTRPDDVFTIVPKVSLYTQIPMRGNGNGLFAKYYELDGSEVVLTVDGEGPINHGWNGSCPGTSFTIYQDACGLWAGLWTSGVFLEEVLTGYVEASQTGHYEFHASIDGDLQITIDGVADEVVTAGAYSIELDLIQGHFYPIEIHYQNDAGTTNLALFWTRPDMVFTIVPRANLYTNNPFMPGVFGKSYPADGDTRVPLSTTLSWSGATDSLGYYYCYYTTNPADCEGAWSYTDQTSIAPPGLKYDTTYHWQVRATNPVGLTEADDDTWWTFTTTPLFIYLPQVISP